MGKWYHRDHCRTHLVARYTIITFSLPVASFCTMHSSPCSIGAIPGIPLLSLRIAIRWSSHDRLSCRDSSATSWPERSRSAAVLASC